MIKSKNGTVKIEGNVIDVLSEFAHITNSLHECISKDCCSEELSRKMIMRSVELGLKNHEEVHKEAMEAIDKVSADAAKAIIKMMKGEI